MAQTDVVAPEVAPPATPEGWQAWEEEQPTRHELMEDGSPRPRPGGPLQPARVLVNLVSLLREQLEDTGCRVTAAASRVDLGGGRWTYPDLVVDVAPGTLPPLGEPEPPREPVAIVEVTSPGTAAWDTQEKRWAYQGVPALRHLVYVAENRPLVEVATRGAGNVWHSEFLGAAGPAEPFRLDALGVTLPMGDIYEGVELSMGPPAMDDAASAVLPRG